MMNDFREQIWKGLLTHNVNGKANLKTYLNKLIKNRIGVLLKRSSIIKYSSTDYYGDVFASTGIDDDVLVTEETGETLLEQRQDAMLTEVEYSVLTVEERGVYEDLLLGRSIDEMMKRRSLNRIAVIAAVNRIDLLING